MPSSQVSDALRDTVGQPVGLPAGTVGQPSPVSGTPSPSVSVAVAAVEAYAVADVGSAPAIESGSTSSRAARRRGVRNIIRRPA